MEAYSLISSYLIYFQGSSSSNTEGFSGGFVCSAASFAESGKFFEAVAAIAEFVEIVPVDHYCYFPILSHQLAYYQKTKA